MNWIDHHTKQMVVEILIFNPNYGIYGTLQLTFNFKKGGYIEKEYFIAAAPAMQYDEHMNVRSRATTIAWDVTAVAVMFPMVLRLVYAVIVTLAPNMMGTTNAAERPLPARIADFVRSYCFDLYIFCVLGPQCLYWFLYYVDYIEGTSKVMRCCAEQIHSHNLLVVYIL